MWDKELNITTCINCTYWNANDDSEDSCGSIGRCELKLELTTEYFHCIRYESKDQPHVG